MKRLLLSTCIAFAAINTTLYGQVLLSSNFNTGTEGWTTSQDAITCQGFSTIPSTWNVTNQCGGSTIVTFASNAFGTPNDGALGAENSWIQSPAFTATSSPLTIDFDSWTANEAGFPCYFDAEYIEMTTDNGATWTTVHGYITAIHDGYEDKTWRNVSLSVPVVPGSSVRIRFRMDTGDDYSDLSSRGWYIDNVVVRSTFDFAFTSANTPCVGSADGSIHFTSVTGGVTPLSYSVDGGITYSSSSSFTSLPAGTYTLLVKDANGVLTPSRTTTISSSISVLSTITYTSPLQFCQNGSVQLNAFNQPGYTFRWRKDGANIPGGTVTSLNATSSGVYDVVTSNGPCSAVSNAVTVTVNSLPTATIASTASCANTNNGTILASASGASPFTFALNNASPVAVGSFNALAAGNYTITITDAQSCIAIVPVTVATEIDLVGPTLVGTADPMFTIRPDQDVTLSQSNLVSQLNDQCGIASVTITPSVLDATHEGLNPVTVTATDFAGNSTSIVVLVTINVIQPPVVSTKNSILALDGNGIATLDPIMVDSGSTNYSGMEVIPSQFDCSSMGTNTVTLHIWNAYGDTVSATAVVEIIDNLAPVTSAQNITINMVGGVATVDANDVNNGTTDNCTINSLTVAPSQFTTSGTFPIVLTVTDLAGNTASASATVTVIAPPSTSVAISATRGNGPVTNVPATTIYLGYGPQTVNLSANASGSPGPFTYSWSGSNRFTHTNRANTTFRPTLPGSYNLVASANSANGNANATINVCVMDARPVTSISFIRNNFVLGCYNGVSFLVFEPLMPLFMCLPNAKVGLCNATCGNSFNKNDLEVEDMSTLPMYVPTEVTAYPNPSQNDINLKLTSMDTDTKVHVLIYDINGRLVSEFKDGEPNAEIEVGSNLNAGIYFAIVRQGQFERKLKIQKLN